MFLQKNIYGATHHQALIFDLTRMYESKYKSCSTKFIILQKGQKIIIETFCKNIAYSRKKNSGGSFHSDSSHQKSFEMIRNIKTKDKLQLQNYHIIQFHNKFEQLRLVNTKKLIGIVVLVEEIKYKEFQVVFLKADIQ